MNVHQFDTAVDAYNACQSGEVADGDVLVVEAEQVVGFLYDAWPVVVTVQHAGQFHIPYPNFYETDGAGHVASAEEARRQAYELGFQVEY